MLVSVRGSVCLPLSFLLAGFPDSRSRVLNACSQSVPRSRSINASSVKQFNGSLCSWKILPQLKGSSRSDSPHLIFPSLLSSPSYIPFPSPRGSSRPRAGSCLLHCRRPLQTELPGQLLVHCKHLQLGNAGIFFPPCSSLVTITLSLSLLTVIFLYSCVTNYHTCSSLTQASLFLGQMSGTAWLWFSS